MKKIDKSQEEKVKTSWFVSPVVKDSFVDFCKKSGTVTQDAAAGALLVWQYLSADIREAAVREALGQDSDLKSYFPPPLDPESSRVAQICALIEQFQRISETPPDQPGQTPAKSVSKSAGGVK